MTIESKTLADAEIYAEHSVALVRFATVLVGADAAQDVVSFAVIRSLNSRGWTTVKNHRGYLFQAVANEARNLHRSDSRRLKRESRVAEANVAHLPEFHPEVRKAIEGLSVRQRAVVYLTYWEDMTDQMAAESLGISAGSVRRHLARAKERLRRVLDD